MSGESTTSYRKRLENARRKTISIFFDLKSDMYSQKTIIADVPNMIDILFVAGATITGRDGEMHTRENIEKYMRHATGSCMIVSSVTFDTDDERMARCTVSYGVANTVHFLFEFDVMEHSKLYRIVMKQGSLTDGLSLKIKSII